MATKARDYIPCLTCGILFLPRRSDHYYCHTNCQPNKQRMLNDPRRSIEGWEVKSPASKGAITELIVCVDLMKKGYHVFRSMSPSCPCDLVVWKQGGSMVKVEVKTGAKSKITGKLYSVTTSTNIFDVICYVVNGQEIIYIPPEDEW